MRNATALFIAAIALSLSTSSARAQESENLLAAVPKGYKSSGERNAAGMVIREMLLGGETKSNWTEMVTVATIPGMGDVSPTQFRSRMRMIWDQYCPGSEYVTLKEGEQHGYTTLTWLWRCPLNRQTGKPELTWMKAIQGRDNLYWVQRAYRFEPSEAQKQELTSYLDGVRICDTRLPDRPCR